MCFVARSLNLAFAVCHKCAEAISHRDSVLADTIGKLEQPGINQLCLEMVAWLSLTEMPL